MDHHERAKSRTLGFTNIEVPNIGFHEHRRLFSISRLARSMFCSSPYVQHIANYRSSFPVNPSTPLTADIFLLSMTGSIEFAPEAVTSFTVVQ